MSEVIVIVEWRIGSEMTFIGASAPAAAKP